MSDSNPGARRGAAEQPLEPDEPWDDPDAELEGPGEPRDHPAAELEGPGEPVASMTAEEAELAARLADDLSRVLRTGVMVEDLEIDHGRPVRIRAVCLVEGAVREIGAEGDNVAEAMGEVVQAAARMRLDAAWWQIVGPT